MCVPGFVNLALAHVGVRCVRARAATAENLPATDICTVTMDEEEAEVFAFAVRAIACTARGLSTLFSWACGTRACCPMCPARV